MAKTKKKKQLPELDEYLGFKQAAATIQPKPVHWMTIYRWSSRGLTIGRRTVKLRTVRVGNRKLTTRRWLNEFFAEQQECEASRNQFLAENRESTTSQLDRELAT